MGTQSTWGSNYIEKLPIELFDLINLKRLYVADNYLDEISPEIKKLTKLERLDFSNNPINDIPQEISTLKNLSWFNFHFGGNIQNISLSLFLNPSMASLKKLFVSSLMGPCQCHCQKFVLTRNKIFPPTLKEIASKEIMRNCLNFDSLEIPWTLVNYLKSLKICNYKNCPKFRNFYRTPLCPAAGSKACKIGFYLDPFVIMASFR